MGATKEIVSKAMKDQGFRQRLIADPKKVLESELGIEFPEGVGVHVHENSTTAIHIVLPGAPEDDRSLSEGDLAEVSGGMSLTIEGPLPMPTGGTSLSPTTRFGCGPAPLPPLPDGRSTIAMGTFGAYTGCCS